MVAKKQCQQRQRHTGGGILNPGLAMVAIGIHNLIRRRRKRDGSGKYHYKTYHTMCPGGFQQEDLKNIININNAHHCTHSSSVIST